MNDLVIGGAASTSLWVVIMSNCCLKLLILALFKFNVSTSGLMESYTLAPYNTKCNHFSHKVEKDLSSRGILGAALTTICVGSGIVPPVLPNWSKSF